MKTKNYEKYHLIFSIIILLIIIELIFFLSLGNHKIEFYQKIPAIVENHNTLTIIISKKEKITLYKSNFFYIDNKKTKYRVIRENKYSKRYYEITIQLETEINYLEKELVDIIVTKEKERLIRIFQEVKDGG